MVPASEGFKPGPLLCPVWVLGQISLSSHSYTHWTWRWPLEIPMNQVSCALRSWMTTVWQFAELRVHPLATSSRQMWAFDRWVQCSSEWLVLAQLPDQCCLPGPALPWTGYTRSSGWPGVPHICHLRHFLSDEPADMMMSYVSFNFPHFLNKK